MMSTIPVLIVGAGPTGLMMAYELARHGISFRIIDKKDEPTNYSNAAALQTRSLEIFKQLGLVDEFLRSGQQCRAICFYDKGKEFARASFDKLNSVYPFVLALPQSTTEKILNDKLSDFHHRIERSRELIAITNHLNSVEATVKHGDGVEEVITCEWLLGCDGAHSTVREKCAFQFPGEDLSGQFIVADGLLDSFLRHDEIHIFSANGYMLGVFPLGGNRFRLAGNTHLEYERKIFTENDIKSMIDERSHGLLSARDVSWISPFWIHSKMSDKMRQGKVFLLGDAAHIHSPVGGQGMNTGLQDAHNLAWKLALVIQGRSDEKLLDSYQDERKPVIKDVVDTTERFTKILMITNPVMLFIRKYITKFMFSVPAICKYVTNRMTQLDICYQHSIALAPGKHSASTSPCVGMRAPDVKLGKEIDLYHVLEDTYHHILCFSGNDDVFKIADCCKKIADELMGPYKDLVKLHFVTPHIIDEPLDQIADGDCLIHKTYKVTKPTLILIRPDGYIGFKSTELDPQPIKNFLASYMH